MRALFGVALLSAAAFAVTPALAGKGYFSGEQGAKASGRGGAYTAKADDLSAVLLNPAGLARLDRTLLQVGNRISYNAHRFTRQPTLDWGALEGGVPPYVEFEATENQKPWQLLDPLVGVASNLGLDDFGFALAVFAPAGIAHQEFPVDQPGRYMMVEREAIILNYTASVAWKHEDVFGIGATLQWIHVPRLTYALVIDASQFPREVNPVSSELDMLSTVTGYDAFTLNTVLGAWYRPLPFLELGLAAQVLPAEVKTTSTMTIEPINPEIVDRVDLRRDGQAANDVSVTLPLPLSARFGIRYVELEGDLELFDIELDVSYESWSRVERFTVDGKGLVANLLGQRVDVGLIEVEKQWQDTWGVHLGGDYAVVPEQLSVRAGLSYSTAIADKSYAHLDFASGPELGAALGASVFFEGVELALAYEYRHQPTWSLTEGEARVYQEVPGTQCREPFTDPDMCHPEFLGRGAPPVNAGTYSAHSHVAAFDVLYRF